jgi:hypothetical protein
VAYDGDHKLWFCIFCRGNLTTTKSQLLHACSTCPAAFHNACYNKHVGQRVGDGDNWSCASCADGEQQGGAMAGGIMPGPDSRTGSPAQPVKASTAASSFLAAQHANQLQLLGPHPNTQQTGLAAGEGRALHPGSTLHTQNNINSSSSTQDLAVMEPRGGPVGHQAEAQQPGQLLLSLPAVLSTVASGSPLHKPPSTAEGKSPVAAGCPPSAAHLLGQGDAGLLEGLIQPGGNGSPGGSTLQAGANQSPDLAALFGGQVTVPGAGPGALGSSWAEQGQLGLAQGFSAAAAAANLLRAPPDPDGLPLSGWSSPHRSRPQQSQQRSADGREEPVSLHRGAVARHNTLEGAPDDPGLAAAPVQTQQRQQLQPPPPVHLIAQLSGMQPQLPGASQAGATQVAAAGASPGKRRCVVASPTSGPVEPEPGELQQKQLAAAARQVELAEAEQTTTPNGEEQPAWAVAAMHSAADASHLQAGAGHEQQEGWSRQQPSKGAGAAAAAAAAAEELTDALGVPVPGSWGRRRKPRAVLDNSAQQQHPGLLAPPVLGPEPGLQPQPAAQRCADAGEPGAAPDPATRLTSSGRQHLVVATTMPSGAASAPFTFHPTAAAGGIALPASAVGPAPHQQRLEGAADGSSLLALASDILQAAQRVAGGSPALDPADLVQALQTQQQQPNYMQQQPMGAPAVDHPSSKAPPPEEEQNEPAGGEGRAAGRGRARAAGGGGPHNDRSTSRGPPAPLPSRRSPRLAEAGTAAGLGQRGSMARPSPLGEPERAGWGEPLSSQDMDPAGVAAAGAEEDPEPHPAAAARTLRRPSFRRTTSGLGGWLKHAAMIQALPVLVQAVQQQPQQQGRRRAGKAGDAMPDRGAVGAGPSLARRPKVRQQQQQQQQGALPSNRWRKAGAAIAAADEAAAEEAEEEEVVAGAAALMALAAEVARGAGPVLQAEAAAGAAGVVAGELNEEMVAYQPLAQLPTWPAQPSADVQAPDGVAAALAPAPAVAPAGAPAPQQELGDHAAATSGTRADEGLPTLQQQAHIDQQQQQQPNTSGGSPPAASGGAADSPEAGVVPGAVGTPSSSPAADAQLGTPAGSDVGALAAGDDGKDGGGGGSAAAAAPTAGTLGEVPTSPGMPLSPGQRLPRRPGSAGAVAVGLGGQVAAAGAAGGGVAVGSAAGVSRTPRAGGAPVGLPSLLSQGLPTQAHLPPELPPAAAAALMGLAVHFGELLHAAALSIGNSVRQAELQAGAPPGGPAAGPAAGQAQHQQLAALQQMAVEAARRAAASVLPAPRPGGAPPAAPGAFVAPASAPGQLVARPEMAPTAAGSSQPVPQTFL